MNFWFMLVAFLLQKPLFVKTVWSLCTRHARVIDNNNIMQCVSLITASTCIIISYNDIIIGIMHVRYPTPCHFRDCHLYMYLQGERVHWLLQALSYDSCLVILWMGAEKQKMVYVLMVLFILVQWCQWYEQVIVYRCVTKFYNNTCTHFAKE